MGGKPVRDYIAALVTPTGCSVCAVSYGLIHTRISGTNTEVQQDANFLSWQNNLTIWQNKQSCFASIVSKIKNEL